MNIVLKRVILALGVFGMSPVEGVLPETKLARVYRSLSDCLCGFMRPKVLHKNIIASQNRPATLAEMQGFFEEEVARLKESISGGTGPSVSARMKAISTLLEIYKDGVAAEEFLRRALDDSLTREDRILNVCALISVYHEAYISLMNIAHVIGKITHLCCGRCGIPRNPEAVYASADIAEAFVEGQIVVEKIGQMLGLAESAFNGKAQCIAFLNVAKGANFNKVQRFVDDFDATYEAEGCGR